MSPKILAVASGGGHWIQLLRFARTFDGLDVAYASTSGDYGADVGGHRYYVINNVTRWDRFKFVSLMVRLIRILIIERPDVVVTAGSAPGVVALALAQLLLRARTVWIDSIANCEQMSSSGLRARHFVDVWLTQWPQLQKDGGPLYWGSVI